ncbi:MULTISPECIES: hypothetical protein [Synechococcales]|uniref:hypothetical protein n=1 Tax=Synechococcus sp. CS-1327 TaxID=2847977 RepID=UPI00223A9ABB|nr:hypothetical protein [Synechococcus sp. CS-1327]MCT0232078.1 hypothetical protein [Synechococcus sp. CS-1327]
MARSLRFQSPVSLAAGLIGMALAIPTAATAQPFYGSGPIPVQVQTMERRVVGYRQVPVYGQVPVVRTQYVQSPVYQAPIDQDRYYQARNFPAPYQDYPNRLANPGFQQAPTSWEEAQALQRRCSIGRLVGGVLGGGIGYAASRQDGRTWAVPLGALLGSQVGCNAGQGRDPLPW